MKYYLNFWNKLWEALLCFQKQFRISIYLIEIQVLILGCSGGSPIIVNCGGSSGGCSGGGGGGCGGQQSCGGQQLVGLLKLKISASAHQEGGCGGGSQKGGCGGEFLLNKNSK